MGCIASFISTAEMCFTNVVAWGHLDFEADDIAQSSKFKLTLVLYTHETRKDTEKFATLVKSMHPSTLYIQNVSVAYMQDSEMMYECRSLNP